MATTLEIITESDEISIDPWCEFVKFEKNALIGTMRFGSAVVGTDTPEIVAEKMETSAQECDRFLDTIEPFVGSEVTVIYNAVFPLTVFIPENGGLSEDGASITWELARHTSDVLDEKVPKLPTDEVRLAMEMFIDSINQAILPLYEKLDAALDAATEKVVQLLDTINAKRSQ